MNDRRLQLIGRRTALVIGVFIVAFLCRWLADVTSPYDRVQSHVAFGIFMIAGLMLIFGLRNALSRHQ